MLAWGSFTIVGEYVQLEGSADEIGSGIRKELSYSGIAQSVIHISYREFTLGGGEAYARPAFYQEVRYDISKGKLIRFQDIRIEIESADQEKIRFTILEGPK